MSSRGDDKIVMTNPKIDNSIANENVILWQYDNAPNLIGLIRKWNDFGKISVTDFWDYYRDVVVNIDRADDFGLNVLGNAFNVPWPSIKIPGSTPSDPSVVSKVSSDFYRRLLKAKMYLMWKPSTVEVFNTYLSFLFPDKSQDPLEKVSGQVLMYKPRSRVLDFQNMSMAYTFPTYSGLTQASQLEEAFMVFQHYDDIFPFPAGIRYPGEFYNSDRVFGFQGQNLKNMAYQGIQNGSLVDNMMVWADEDVVDSTGTVVSDGGIFAGTEKANYKISPNVHGKAFVVDSQTLSRPVVSGLVVGSRYWIDFGDGAADYITPVSSSYTKPTAYVETGLYGVCVYTDANTTTMNVTGGLKTYTI